MLQGLHQTELFATSYSTTNKNNQSQSILASNSIWETIQAHHIANNKHSSSEALIYILFTSPPGSSLSDQVCDSAYSFSSLPHPQSDPSVVGIILILKAQQPLLPNSITDILYRQWHSWAKLIFVCLQNFLGSNLEKTRLLRANLPAPQRLAQVNSILWSVSWSAADRINSIHLDN